MFDVGVDVETGGTNVGNAPGLVAAFDENDMMKQWQKEPL